MLTQHPVAYSHAHQQRRACVHCNEAGRAVTSNAIERLDLGQAPWLGSLASANCRLDVRDRRARVATDLPILSLVAFRRCAMFFFEGEGALSSVNHMRARRRKSAIWLTAHRSGHPLKRIGRSSCPSCLLESAALPTERAAPAVCIAAQRMFGRGRWIERACCGQAKERMRAACVRVD